MSVAPFIEIPYRIAMALTMASSATGTDYDYLMKTAARESNFEISAKARTSSATGLFQFIEGTWLRMVKHHGPKYGLNKYANRIFVTRDGRYYVPDRRDRKRILSMRRNPEVAALMAGAYTKLNEKRLEDALGQKPRAGELYIAHFLGPTDAVRLIKAAIKYPSRSAVRMFPKAARANRPIFYAHGRHRTVLQVYRNLVAKHEREVTTRIASANASPSKGRTRKRARTARPIDRYKRTVGSSYASKHLIRAGQPRRIAAVAPPTPRLFKLRGSLSHGGSNYILRGRKGLKVSKASSRSSSWITQTEAMPQSARVLTPKSKR